MLDYYVCIYTLLILIDYKGVDKMTDEMTNEQRLKNDIATTDRREMTDKVVNDNRMKNDEETAERRTKVDNNLNESRMKNDKITADRREAKDVEGINPLVVVLLTITLALSAYFVFFS